MILELLFNAILLLLKTVFSILPDMPQLPDTILSSVDTVMDILFDNVHLLGFFFPINTIKIMIPLILLVVNFERIYHFTMWIIKKLPIGVKD